MRRVAREINGTQDNKKTRKKEARGKLKSRKQKIIVKSNIPNRQRGGGLLC
jgi:hypothetical protein